MMMNPVFVRRGLNAAAGFIVPGSMVDNTFVLDSFVAAAANNTPRRRPQNNNNSNLFSSQVATRRDVGPNLLNGRGRGRIIDDTIFLFDNNSYSYVANNTMGSHNNAPFNRSPQYDFINVDETSKTDNDGLCSICLCDHDSNAVQLRGCSHVFHKDCIEKWISVRRTCPLCRSDI
ncbi:hypothetical protein TSUD_368480 [Trifolium subterraneum]|uniref:RING-type domain-containing protein n=1 Tax=Trifolium subterraneum TaxID=3900 RepID=A0A2Z6MFR9_TRISU|nr:hypothetical protein TSUD_368480 [Trifolium subterraneum]